MPISLQKGQKVSLTKGNPGLKKVVVGLGWDVNQLTQVEILTLMQQHFCLVIQEKQRNQKILYFMEILLIRQVQYSIWETISQVKVTEMMSKSK